jgi:hypothetical protein
LKGGSGVVPPYLLLSGSKDNEMADEERAPTRLQVANMRPDDSGRGIARLPRAVMTALGLKEGDVVELVGKRSTPARAVHPYPEDEGLSIIRLDGCSAPMRRSARATSSSFARPSPSPPSVSSSRPPRRICDSRDRPMR